MSFMALQRVAVRMLLDPHFARAVFETPEQTLAGIPLSPEERSWLTQSEQRAWRLDVPNKERELTMSIQLLSSW